MIEYPGLPRDYVMEMVHRFYDEYYFRPKAIFRIVSKAVFNSVERKRLYKEAKSFMKLRAARNRAVKETRRNRLAMPPPPATGTPQPGAAKPRQPSWSASRGGCERSADTLSCSPWPSSLPAATLCLARGMRDFGAVTRRIGGCSGVLEIPGSSAALPC